MKADDTPPYEVAFPILLRAGIFYLSLESTMGSNRQKPKNID